MHLTTHCLNRTLHISLLAAALALGLSGCGNKDDKKTATQVAAKVGSEEISVHQINQVLSRSNAAGASPQAAQVMSREVLEKLIDQQLAIDQAMDSKLHRSAEVVSQIEFARRDILARAYIQRLTAGLPKPTAQESKKYFTEHPQLFSERRIFNVQEIMLPAGAAVLDALRGFAAAGKPMEEIASWLKAKSIDFKGGAATRAAEQIPLEMLPKLHALKDGQSAVLESAQGVTVVHLVSSQAAPVTEAAALPRIEQFLGNQRAAEAVAARLKQLRADTKVTYMGEFAAPAGTPDKTATAVATPIKSGQTAIEKGVAGLK